MSKEEFTKAGVAYIIDTGAGGYIRILKMGSSRRVRRPWCSQPMAVPVAVYFPIVEVSQWYWQCQGRPAHASCRRFRMPGTRTAGLFDTDKEGVRLETGSMRPPVSQARAGLALREPARE